jgi:type I restriction enzyme R subunit
MQQDFAPFRRGDAQDHRPHRQEELRDSISALYQAVTGAEEWKQIYRQFPADFFDLIVIDECHRGSAADDSAWREVLDYFADATHLGMTATPKEKKPEKGETQIKDPEFNLKYFGNPIYTLFPEARHRRWLSRSLQGHPRRHRCRRARLHPGARQDRQGRPARRAAPVQHARISTANLILTQRTEFVAQRVWEYLKATDPMAKTIVFCDDQPHAERMRQELVKLIPEAASNRRYVGSHHRR